MALQAMAFLDEMPVGDLRMIEAEPYGPVLESVPSGTPFARQVNARVRDTYAILGQDDPALGGGPGERLDAALTATLEVIAKPRGSSRATVLRCARQVNELQQLRLRLAETRTTVLAARQDRLRIALSGMRSIRDTANLLDVVPEELTRCGFQRAWLSRLDGSDWALASHHALEVELTPETEVARCSEFRALVPETHEAEATRRRRAVLVDHQTRSRPDPQMARTFGLRTYVTAPLLADSRVIGLLHADHGRYGLPVTEDDRQIIGLFAEAAGHVIQRVVLLDRFETLRQEVRRMTDAVGGMVDETCWASIDIRQRCGSPAPAAPAPVRGSRTGAGAPRVRSDARLAAVLTERELEVLRLMATGSTNAQIASELVISQGTVKSHVKHILRKLHASNRAQAVSRAFRILDTHERGAD
ncbi:MAG: hypothetical protein QOF76_2479 [Solirubrobacteraceae bacterium]|nr:hypothetical protein [Solirubrobacteraceae bacterium]